MRIMKYIQSLIRANTLDSSKSFALVLSVIVGAVIGLCVCFCLIWDVCLNGYIKTDLDSLGIFLLCAGGFMAGGGASKTLSDRKRSNLNNKKGGNIYGSSRETETASQANAFETE